MQFLECRSRFTKSCQLARNKGRAMDVQWHELARFLPAKTTGRPKQQGLVPVHGWLLPPYVMCASMAKLHPTTTDESLPRHRVQAKTWPYLLAAALWRGCFPVPVPRPGFDSTSNRRLRRHSQHLITAEINYGAGWKGRR